MRKIFFLYAFNIFSKCLVYISLMFFTLTDSWFMFPLSINATCSKRIAVWLASRGNPIWRSLRQAVAQSHRGAISWAGPSPTVGSSGFGNFLEVSLPVFIGFQNLLEGPLCGFLFSFFFLLFLFSFRFFSFSFFCFIFEFSLLICFHFFFFFEFPKIY